MRPVRRRDEARRPAARVRRRASRRASRGRSRARARGGRARRRAEACSSSTTMYVRFAPGRDATARPGCAASAGSSVGDTRFSATSARPASSRSARAFSSWTVRSVDRVRRPRQRRRPRRGRAAPRPARRARRRTDRGRRASRRAPGATLPDPRRRMGSSRSVSSVACGRARRTTTACVPVLLRRRRWRRRRCACRDATAGDAKARSVATTSLGAERRAGVEADVGAELDLERQRVEPAPAAAPGRARGASVSGSSRTRPAWTRRVARSPTASVDVARVERLGVVRRRAARWVARRSPVARAGRPQSRSQRQRASAARRGRFPCGPAQSREGLVDPHAMRRSGCPAPALADVPSRFARAISVPPRRPPRARPRRPPAPRSCPELDAAVARHRLGPRRSRGRASASRSSTSTRAAAGGGQRAPRAQPCVQRQALHGGGRARDAPRRAPVRDDAVGQPRGRRRERASLAIRGYGDPSLATTDLWSHGAGAQGATASSASTGDVVVDQRFYDEQTTPPAFDQQPNEWAGVPRAGQRGRARRELRHDDGAPLARRATRRASSSTRRASSTSTGASGPRRAGGADTVELALSPATARA